MQTESKTGNINIINPKYNNESRYEYYNIGKTPNNSPTSSPTNSRKNIINKTDNNKYINTDDELL